MRVLVIDDDEDYREYTVAALEGADISYVSASNADEGRQALEAHPTGHFDLILLDVDMPGPSGWDTLIALRESGNEIPVIFVSGCESVEERVRGLRLGADDYLVKPVAYEELLARMDVVLRRRRELTPVEYGDLRLDLARRKVERAGTRVDLSPREYDLLLALVQAKGEVKSRTEILEEVWDMQFDPGTNVLDVHIGRLRRKLDRHGRPAIETVRGKGYRIVRRQESA